MSEREEMLARGFREEARRLFEPWDGVAMGDPGGYGPSEAEVAEAIAAAVAAEREACAQLADRAYSQIGDRVTVQQKIAAAIRSRGAVSEPAGRGD